MLYKGGSYYSYELRVMSYKLFLILVLGMLLSGCRSIEYYPVETFRTDTVYVNRLAVDSILVRDSIYIHEKGDTVTEFRYHYIYRYKDRVDTLYLASRDTVSVPYPVEKELTKWQSFKVDYGGWAIGAVFVFILIVFGGLIYKLKK